MSYTIESRNARLKTFWDRSPQIRAGFTSFEAFAAYCVAEANGQVKVPPRTREDLMLRAACQPAIEAVR